ncbi:MAG: CdaR family protein [Chloroflexota bacterium]
MSRQQPRRESPLALAGLLARGTATSLSTHWALALFSVGAAFAIWFVIEDVENPRAKGLVPLESEQSIPVEPINVPDGFIVPEIGQVRVNVEAREDDLEDLRAGDFRATVNLEGVSSESVVNLPVQVQSRRGGVRVLSVLQPVLEVRVERAAVRELPVEVRRVGEPPDGYVIAGPPTIEPPFVTVRGRKDLVDSLQALQVDVNLSGSRDDTATFEGDIVARTSTGNTVNLTLSQDRAKVTFKLEQTFSQRTLTLVPNIVGTPAPGYIVSNVVVKPPTVVVTGPKAIVDRLGPLPIAQLDVTGAKEKLTRTQQIERPQNVSLERQTVQVEVELKPIECSSQAGAPCASPTFFIGPEFTGLPAGLAIETATSTVQVRLSGPLAQIAALKIPGDIRALVSLSGAGAGRASYAVIVTLPPGLQVRVESAEPVTVTLIPVVLP